jgi:CRISPR-associated protein Cas6/Cse3/CasE subtype I-E
MLSAARYPIVLFGPLQLPPILPHDAVLYAVLRKSGFRVDRANVIGYHTETIPRSGRKPIELGVLDLEGDITVDLPDRFLSKLAHGFGKARSFGCGLMLIKRRL